MSWEIWGPPIVVALVGLTAGLVLALRARSGAPTPDAASRPLTVEDLRARKDALVEQLRSLESERGKLQAAEFEQRWRRTLEQAARALRDLEAGAQPAPHAATSGSASAPLAATVAAPAPAEAASPTGRRLAWTLGAVAFFVVLGISMSQATRPREGGGGMTGGGGMSGGGMSGGGMSGAGASSAGGGSAQGSGDPRVQAALAAYQSNPQDVDAAAFLAHDAIRTGDLQSAMQYVEAGRQASPDDPRIQASLAALMIVIGSYDKADTTLQAVFARSPDLPQAWLWQGLLHMRRGELESARAALQKVAVLSEDAYDRRLATAMLSELDNPGAQAAAGGAEAGGASAGGATAGGATATDSAAAVRVTGRLSVAEGLSVPSGSLVFVYARSAADAKGPPLAALRIPGGAVPTDFQITDADRPMQQVPWPDQVWLQARVDLDGNAMTRETGAPVSASVGPVSAGSGPVELLLQAP